MRQLNHILFVCADPVFIEKMSTAFADKQYRFCVHHDEASRLLAEGYVPDLLVVDLVLPQLTGPETLDALQQKLHPQVVPGIITTSNDRLVLYSLPRAPELLGVVSKRGDEAILYKKKKKIWDEYQALLLDGEPEKASIFI